MQAYPHSAMVQRLTVNTIVVGSILVLDIIFMYPRVG